LATKNRLCLLADIKGRFEALSIEAVGNTPEQAGKFLEDEIAKWAS